MGEKCPSALIRYDGVCSLHNRYLQFDDDVASHVEYASSSGDRVHVRIFQPAEMMLVSLVRQVAYFHEQAGNLLSAHRQVAPSREVEQRVAGRCRLRLLSCVEVILSEIARHAHSDEGVIEKLSVVRNLVFHLGVPSCRRRERQILALVRLVALCGVDH